MPLQITGRHTTVTPQQREYIESKIDRLSRFFDHVDEMAFTLSAEKQNHIVEISFRAGTIKSFTKCSDVEPMAAIDKAIDKLAIQLAKAKEKRSGNKKHQGRRKKEGWVAPEETTAEP